MLFQLSLALAATLFLGAATLFAITVIKTVGARRWFEKKSGGMKMIDKFSVWAGHINSYVFAEGQMYLTEEVLKRNKAKTMGFLYGCRVFALSVDLDLIKRMVLDGHETERQVMNIPVHEVQVDSILTARTQQWAGIRRAFAPAVKSNKFKTPNVQREIDSSISKLIKAIDSKLNASADGKIDLDVEDYAHRYSLDLVLSCFYKQTDLIDFGAQVDRMSSLVNSGLENLQWNPMVRVAILFPQLTPVVDWLIFKFHSMGAWRRMILNFIKRQTMLNFEARRELEKLKESAGGQVQDENNFVLRDGTKFNRNMIDHVIDQFYEGKLTKREFFHSTWFLMSAADKTASDSIAHTIYQLAVHRDIQEKLRQSTLVEGEESEYLTWVLNESLRLLPPAPIGCSRTASCDYKCEDGVVPAGTFVVTATYAIHRLPEYWGSNANEFQPERFAHAKDFHPMQFMPFGAGARGCLGKEFAMHEMKKLLCALITRYKFSCEPTDLRYSSPLFIFQVPNRHVHVAVSRV